MISILYVDDETSLLELTKQYLERTGMFAVDTADSAQAALEKIQSMAYDAIVSDYQMPGMDGIQLLKSLRTSGDFTPFIISTGKGREEIVIQAFEHGADAYLQKGGEPKSQFADLAQKVTMVVELRAAERARRESEQKLHDIIDFLPDATFAIDKEGRVIAWNRAIEEMTGVSEGEILGKGNFEHSLPFYGKRRPILIDLALLSDEEIERNYIYVRWENRRLIAESSDARPRGREVVLWGMATPLYNSQGRLIGAIESIRDITDRKQVEEALRESENRLHFTLKAAHSGSWDWDIPSGRLTWSPEFFDLFGIPLDAPPTIETWLASVHPDDRERTMEKIDWAIREGTFFWNEYRIILPDGQERWIGAAGSPSYDKDGNPLRVSGLGIDITDRKRAEEALSLSESRFRELFNNISSGVAVFAAVDDGTDFVFRDFNRAAERIDKIKKEDVIGRSVSDAFPGVREFGLLDIFSRVWRTGQPEHHPISHYKDGRIAGWRENFVSPLPSGEIVSVYDDITDRKQAEEALQAMVRSMVGSTGLESLRKITENVSSWLGADCVMIGEIQPDNETVKVLSMLLDGKEVPDFSYTLKGTPCENVAERGFCLYPDNVIRLFPESKDLVELTIQGYMGTPLRDSGGNVIGILCVLSRSPLKPSPTVQEFMDIIAVKAAAEIERTRIVAALKESERRYRDLFNNANDQIIVAEIGSNDLPGRIIDVNDRTCETLGYTKAELLSLSISDIAMPESPEQMAMVGKSLRSTAQATFEAKQRGKEGRIIPVEVSLKFYEDHSLSVGIIRDITKRKQTAEALRESQQKLAEAMNLANLVNWEYDVGTGIFTFDDRFYALYGTTEEREGGSQMSAEMYAREFVHPEDRGVVAEEVEKALKTSDPQYMSQLEHRIIRRDGEIRHIVVRIGITKDAEGRTIKTHGANQDITERKRAEDALRSANRQLNLLTGVTRHDIINKITVILGYLEIAEINCRDPALIEYLGKMKSATTAIQSQIEFTRVYQDLGTHEPRWIDLDTVMPCSQVPATITLTAEVQGVRVFADAMLEKVFFNLLDNSIRHGQRVTGIRVSSHKSGQDLVVVWEDNGIGIAANEKERIFECGFGKNTGLGLFLSREILAVTGITTLETGEPGKGARFEIRVPDGAYRVQPAPSCN